tara:strand:+ start:264 stop:533 length:270 start_codon:yes stop_codon:yes gene_type:complete
MKQTLLIILLIATSLSVSAKWSKSPIGFYDLFHSEGSKIIDISYPDGQKMSKVFTTLQYGGDLYRCVQMIFDFAQSTPKTEHCWILVPN